MIMILVMLYCAGAFLTAFLLGRYSFIAKERNAGVLVIPAAFCWPLTAFVAAVLYCFVRLPKKVAKLWGKATSDSTTGKMKDWVIGIIATIITIPVVVIVVFFLIVLYKIAWGLTMTAF